MKLIYYFLSILINSNLLHHLVHFNLFFFFFFFGCSRVAIKSTFGSETNDPEKESEVEYHRNNYILCIYTMCRRRRLPPLSPAVYIFYIYFMNSQYHMGRLQISTCEREQNFTFQLNLYMMMMMAYTLLLRHLCTNH